MDAHTKVSGAWKKLTGIHTKVSGAWKEVKNGYIKVGGVWKQFYANTRVILSGTSGSPNVDSDFAIHPSTAQAGWTFISTGDLTRVSGAAHNKPEWYGQPGETTHETPDQTYYIRATNESGDNPDSGPALNTWHSLGTRQWYWSASGGFDLSQGTLKIEIATDSGGTNIIATGYYRGSAQTEL